VEGAIKGDAKSVEESVKIVGCGCRIAGGASMVGAAFANEKGKEGIGGSLEPVGSCLMGGI